jgi:N-carbamoyl-L-amino-acid hydrolase
LLVNEERLVGTLKQMAQIGFVSEEKGINRLALNESDKKARELFVQWLKEAGLKVQVDPIGNISGIRKGKHGYDNPVVMGSHLDTVGEGGAFDGAIGVLGALEVIRTLNDNAVETEKPVAIMNFTHEEGPRFNRNMMGSVALTKSMKLDDIYAMKDRDGITVLDALKKTGFLGTDPWLKAESYFELHIEQGPVLEMEKKQIGVVEGIQGIVWYECVYKGEASHAGPTPLEVRKDSLLGAADLFCNLRELAVQRQDRTVVTVGCCDIYPNEINVIPGKTAFTVDVRQFDPYRFNEVKMLIKKLVGEIAAKHSLEWEMKVKTEVLPVAFAKEMVDLVEAGAKKLGYTYKRMPSAAGHDAQLMHQVCPTAMIFVPSVGGVSHTPKEKTEFKDIAHGTNILLSAVLERADA